MPLAPRPSTPRVFPEPEHHTYHHRGRTPALRRCRRRADVATCPRHDGVVAQLRCLVAPTHGPFSRGCAGPSWLRPILRVARPPHGRSQRRRALCPCAAAGGRAGGCRCARPRRCPASAALGAGLPAQRLIVYAPVYGPTTVRTRFRLLARLAQQHRVTAGLAWLSRQERGADRAAAVAGPGGGRLFRSTPRPPPWREGESWRRPGRC